MKPEPILGEPVLRVGDALAIADVHIGVEKTFIHAGVAVPSTVDAFLDSLSGLAEANGSEVLIVLGDLKDTIAYATRWEFREVPRFLEGTKGIFSEVHVIRGNHDAGIGTLVPDGVILHGTEGWVHEGTGFAHGHRWPSKDLMEEDLLVVGHNHPVVTFVDSLGSVTHTRCWLRAEFRESHPRYKHLPRELVKMPAFNHLLGGASVNVKSPRLLGPLMRADVVDVAGAEVFLEDGAHVGTLGDLPPAPPSPRRSKRNRDK